MRKTAVSILVLLTVLFAFVSCDPTTVEVPSLETTSATIKGVLDLPESGKVSGSDVWIKVVSNGETRNISQANADGSFSVSGLRETEKYDILFSTVKPETSNERSLSRDASGTTGYGGWLSNVTAAINEGNNVGSVSIKPLGTIKGNVTLDGESEHYDILVYIPGTSFSAFTNASGDFYLYNVPESTYTLRATSLKSGFGSAMSENVTVRGSKNNNEEHPVVQMDSIVLYRDLGTIEGKILLDSQDDASGISILIRNAEGSRTYTSSTDSTGNFLANDVKPGTYTLYASKTGFDTLIVENVIVSPAATRQIPVQTLSSGVRYLSGKVLLEGKTIHSGALITATNTKETSLVYSAITNDSGDYSLVNMKPGEYRIVITMNNYNAHIVGVVSVLKDSVVTLDTVNLQITRGTISGSATLEGRSSNAGIKVELMKGTEVYATTTTDDSGLYSFRVPQGNYSGVRLSCEDFRSVSIAQSIALIANDYVTIEGGTTNMVATHVPTVKGRVTVTGILDQDFSGIRVSLENTDMSTTTDENGNWSFTKVPVGVYTLRFERENTRLVTKDIVVKAMAEMTIETLALEPNAASIEGHVTLNGMTDHSGITVTATAEGAPELRTTTNAAGYFYMGNVITTKTYTVTFSKDGWDSQSRSISGLENLSLNDITASNPIELVDTTAPVLSSYTITTGNSEAEGRKINIHFNMTETGSGATKVYISTTNDFSSVEPVNYANPLSCYVPDIAGTHILYVKVQDKSGNMSEVKEQNYTVADYKTVVSGVLVDNEDGVNDGVITWTKNRSPYYVTGNILIEGDKTLIIEPGVNVQFSGEYYMQVEGKLLANGTEAENVYFYGVGAGENNWTGIKGVFSKGSKLSYSTLTNMNSGIQGYIDIEYSEIHATSNSYALGSDSSPYSSTIMDSVIDGRINTSYARFNTCSIMLPTGFSYRSSTKRTDFYESTVSGGYLTVSDGASYNSSFQSVALTYEYFTSVNTGFNGCSLSITGGMIYLSELNNCTFSKFNYGTINDSNIIGCGTISTSIKKSDHPKFSLTGNYWGETNTAEISRNGVNSNLSFIVDYYDDFNVTKIDLSGYKTAPIAEAGRKTIEFTEAEYEIGDRGPAGGYIFYDKGYYSDGWRYLEAAPSDLGSYSFGYYREFDEGNNIRTGTGYGIGTGRVNTELLVADMGESAYTSSSGSSKTGNYAAKLCADYSLNGYDDWFLPSRDELNLMYMNLHKNGVGSFDYYNYWSSSEDGNYTGSAWYQYFSNGGQYNYNRYSNYRVRSVRAF